MHCFSNLFW